MKCKLCKQTITQGEHYYHQPDSYEFAEIGHKYTCPNYLWDYKTLGPSSARVFKEPVRENTFIPNNFESLLIKWENEHNEYI